MKAPLPDAVGVVAPIRVQLSRKKGWRLPPNTVSVARPGRWGNPFRVGDFGIPTAADAVQRYREWLDGRVVGPPIPDLSPLKGKHVACWCRLGDLCHADVIRERANPSQARSLLSEGRGDYACGSVPTEQDHQPAAPGEVGP